MSAGFALVLIYTWFVAIVVGKHFDSRLDELEKRLGLK